jgi:hypothetical protein
MYVLYSTVHPNTLFRDFFDFFFNFQVVHSPSPPISQDRHTDSAQAKEQSYEARDQRPGTGEGVGEGSIRLEEKTDCPAKVSHEEQGKWLVKDCTVYLGSQVRTY